MINQNTSSTRLKALTAIISIAMFTISTSAIAFNYSANSYEESERSYKLRERIIQKHKVVEIQKSAKPELIITKSRQHIDITSFDPQSKYIITVKSNSGFISNTESEWGSVNINELNLPHDGTYDYEIKSVRFIDEEVKDTINNGRSPDASTKASIVSIKSGQINVQNGDILTQEETQESRPNNFPNNNFPNKPKRYLFK